MRERQILREIERDQENGLPMSPLLSGSVIEQNYEVEAKLQGGYNVGQNYDQQITLQA